MTAIIRLENGDVKVMIKGADSVIIPRLLNPHAPLISTTHHFLNEFAS